MTKQLLFYVVFSLLTTFCSATAISRAIWWPFEHIYNEKRQSTSDATSLQVDLGYSVYQGAFNATTNLRSWFGIRYAAPPLGSLRWQAPEPPLMNRTAVISATAFGPQCPQTQMGKTSRPSRLGNEDCLYLDVYSPANASNLPVLFYIHGGGGGLGNAHNANPVSLMVTNNNRFVTVAVQYRLGAFGWLASDEVSRFGATNAGLLDQHFALQWVQQYVALFGGNPRQVTIAGESSGAGNVMLHTMAYGGTLGDSLFTNAIASSPWLPQQYPCSGWIPSQSYYAFANRAGCFNGSAYGGGNETILQCLQRQDSTTLQYASFNVSSSGKFGTWAFVPCTDGDYIQDVPSSQLLQQRVNGKSMLIGNNAVEGAPFVNASMSTIDDLMTWLQITYPLFTNDDFAQVLAQYPNDNRSYPSTSYGWATTGDAEPSANNISSFAIGQKQRAINIYSESTFICPSYWLNQAFSTSSSSNASTGALTSWHYQYSVPSAYHAADLSALFGPPQRTQSQDFVTALRTIWGNFIVTSDPRISDAVANGPQGSGNSTAQNPASTWPKYDPQVRQMLNLNSTGGTPTVVPGLLYWTSGNTTEDFGPGGLQNKFNIVDMDAWEAGRGRRCEFWRSVGPITPA